jgi:hypothetical protein
VFKIGVAVGRVGGVQIKPFGIKPAKVILKFLAHQLLSATQAADKIKPTVQVDDPVVAGGLMKSIHVLR